MSAAIALAEIGHNNPPSPTPYDLSRDEIEGLFLEAKNWLDGSGVQSQDDADAVAKLLNMLGEARRTAEDRRKEEARPFDEGKAKVQDRYNALIGKTKSATGKAILAEDACRKALTPWLQRKEEERRAAAEAARRAAEDAAREAALAFQVTRADDLAGREDAEAMARDAKVAEADARKAERSAASGLRTVTTATVTDHRAFLNWVAANRPDALRGWLQTYAETLCAQKTRDLPGVSYSDERVAR